MRQEDYIERSRRMSKYYLILIFILTAFLVELVAFYQLGLFESIGPIGTMALCIGEGVAFIVIAWVLYAKMVKAPFLGKVPDVK
ncbi:MAG: hypothetical protein ACFCUX_08075 [Candidatus Methylacidiphilales bacterium]